MRNLIREGAILTETADDVLRGLLTLRTLPLREAPGPVWPETRDTDPGDSELAEARRIVLEALSPTPVAVDELARGCQVSLPIVLTVLLEFELAGRLERQPGQRVSLIP